MCVYKSMVTMNRIVGLVLAGGKSSRMGQDKALLPWKGSTLQQHMSDILNRAGVSRVLVSGSGCSDNTLNDIIPDRGPLSGVHAGLQQLKNGDLLLMVPVDMPLLPVDSVRELAVRASTCCYEGYTLPMLLCVNDRTRERVEQAIQSDQHRDYSLWRLHKSLNGEFLPLAESQADFFINTNTPLEWVDALNRSTEAHGA